MMVELETMIIALVVMTYILGTNLYVLHPMDERVFNDSINDK